MRKATAIFLALWLGLFSTLSVASTCCPQLDADQSPTAADKTPCHDAEATGSLARSVTLDNLNTSLPDAAGEEFCAGCSHGCQCLAASFMLDAMPILHGAINIPNKVIASGVDAVLVVPQINPFRPPIV